MLPEAASAAAEPTPLEAFGAHLAATGRRGSDALAAAARFLRRWPTPEDWAGEPLDVRLSLGAAGPFVVFLCLGGRLHPGYDFLIARKFPSFWRELTYSPLRTDVERFLAGAAQLGFSDDYRRAVASEVIGRVLIQTGRPMAALNRNDLDELAAACRDRQQRTGASWEHYAYSLQAARRVLFQLGVLTEPPAHALTRLRQRWDARMATVPEPLRDRFIAYLERLGATHARSTVSGTAGRLAYFGQHVGQIAPGLSSLAQLERAHIESYLAAVAKARTWHTGAPLSAAERRGRVLAVSGFLNNITEWGWPDAPARRLVFRADIPKRPRALPRYLPPDADRRLVEALEASTNRLAADALLLQRACGLRIGELVDLELDCVHEIPGQGAWLKVPLGKLDSERMVPIDEPTVDLVDRIVAHRSPGQPLRHPRTGRLVEFLLTHYGKRVSIGSLQDELARAGHAAGLGRVTSHQLRHTYATALVNAGVSLQSLMILLGHTTAAMSLRYGRLFDATVRAEYERALTLAKDRLGPLLPDATPVQLTTDWRHAPLIKARLAGGYCLRTPAQGACPYTNICEHCPNFRSDAGFLAVLGAQRVDAETLAHDAEQRGWAEEATRHRRLIERLDTLIARAEAG